MILWPLVFQLVLAAPLMYLLRLLYHALEDRPWFRATIRNFIGSLHQPKVKKPAFLVACLTLQFIFSFSTVVLWVWRSIPPHHRTDIEWEWEDLCERIMMTFFLLHYFVNCLREEFTLAACWNLAALVDVFTVIPCFFTLDANLNAAGQPWLTLGFLRAYRVLLSYQRVESTGIMHAHTSEFTRAVITMVLRSLALVVIMGCSVYTLEVLGEVEGVWYLEPYPYSTKQQDDLSVVQMLYWCLTTVTTVGYGDFAPRTVLSRLFACVFMVLGVTYFTFATDRAFGLKKLLEAGKGSYCLGERHDHVVICGTAVGHLTPTMKRFLQELFHPEHEPHGWPDIVFLRDRKSVV